MGEFSELFKEHITILVALVFALSSWTYQLMYPSAILTPQIEQWGAIAVGFFFGSVTTNVMMNKGYEAARLAFSGLQPEE